MSNTLIVTGSGATKEAALQEAQERLAPHYVLQCNCTYDYDAAAGLWGVTILAVVEDEVGDKPRGFLARLRGGGA